MEEESQHRLTRFCATCYECMCPYKPMLCPEMGDECFLTPSYSCECPCHLVTARTVATTTAVLQALAALRATGCIKPKEGV